MSYFKGFGNGSNSNGQFWYGRPQNFPGFLYKKNTGVGGRKNPLYGLICNKPTYIYNKFKPGTGGVGAQNRANRRAKNMRATVCVDHNCERFYNYLGLFPRFSYKSIDGYFPYPLPLTYYNASGDYRSLYSSKTKNLLVFTGNGNFTVFGYKPITLNYIFVGGGGGGGAGGSDGGAGGGGGGGGQVVYGKYDIYPGYHTVVVGDGGKGGNSSNFNLSTNGTNGGNTYLYNNDGGSVLINANGGEAGKYGEGSEKTNGGVGGASTGTFGSKGGKNRNEIGENGIIGGGGGGSNYYTVVSTKETIRTETIPTPGPRSPQETISITTTTTVITTVSVKGGDGEKNISINNIDFVSIIQNIFSSTNKQIDIPVDIPSDFKINNFSQIFGTGGGAGNAATDRVIEVTETTERTGRNTDRNTTVSQEHYGGKGGKGGGIIIGEGGIGNNNDSLRGIKGTSSGNNGESAVSFLGGGAGGGGGGAQNGNGGNGGNGGQGLIILFFNIY
jgi:hypothetical protein